MNVLHFPLLRALIPILLPILLLDLKFSQLWGCRTVCHTMYTDYPTIGGVPFQVFNSLRPLTSESSVISFSQLFPIYLECLVLFSDSSYWHYVTSMFSGLEKLFLLSCAFCLHLSVRVLHRYMVLMEAGESIGCAGARITDVVSRYVNTGNQTCILCKSKTCSSPLWHLSSLVFQTLIGPLIKVQRYKS